MAILKDRKKIWLTLYIFMVIFQPPFLPINLIYAIGLFTLVLIIMDQGPKVSLTVLNDSKMNQFFKILLFLTAYLVFISWVDSLFITDIDFGSNRLKTINQLIVLTPIQLLCVYYVLIKADRYQYGEEDIFDILIAAGVLQGVLAIIAYTIPSARSFFLRYMGPVFDNIWNLQRRGYGFSLNLVDTFGYGMGLLAGYGLLRKRKNTFVKIGSISLILLSILLNARTGIIVFMLALVLYLLKSSGLIKSLFRLVLTFGVLSGIYAALPTFIKWGVRHENFTIKWIANGIGEIYMRLNGTYVDTNSSALVSHKVALSTNPFELIFGSGHSVYGTSRIIGEQTDIGYTNLLWIYGFLGFAILLYAMLRLFKDSYIASTTIENRYIAVFNCLAYFIVMIKANLLGNNPGTFITYMVSFMLIYFGNKQSSDTLIK